MQHRRAGFFPKRDRALRLEHSAVARVGVGEDRHRRDAADATDVLEHLGLREHAEIRGARDDGGGDETAHEDGRRARLLGEHSRDGVVGAEANERRFSEQLAGLGGSGHFALCYLSPIGPGKIMILVGERIPRVRCASATIVVVAIWQCPL